MKIGLALGLGLALLSASAGAQTPAFPPERISKGAELFAKNCATCHGAHMRNPPWAIDLKQFPHEEHSRFVDSVTYGKRNMPSWEDALEPDDIEALWSYVVAGEPRD